MQIASETITTTEGLRALHVALSEHAELAAQAARRAKTPAARVAHAEIETLLRNSLDQWALESRWPELFAKTGGAL
jgi:hypothetical protein